MTIPAGLPPTVRDRLGSLAPDQRVAAMAPPGPVLCVAPAGSGKTTTIVARVAWRVASGADPASITAIAFNRRAAVELGERLDGALAPLGCAAGAVRVRTFHALGLEILRDAGRDVRVVDRAAILRRLRPTATADELARLDTAISRLKVELGVTLSDVVTDEDPGDLGRAYVEYQATLDALEVVDFDDLITEAGRALQTAPDLLRRWHARCADLLVDEVQDLDRAQLELARSLAGDRGNMFLVGDDDQSIYGWRLADVRRLLEVAAATPGLVRVDLEVNYRCPAPVVERAARLVERNRERLAKRIRPRSGAVGWLALVADGRPDPLRLGAVLRQLPTAGGTQAFLARTNRELLPAIVTAVAMERPFRCEIALPIEDDWVDEVIAGLRTEASVGPLLPRIDRVAHRLLQEAGEGPLAEPADDDRKCSGDDLDAAPPPLHSREAIGRSILGWAAGLSDVDALAGSVARMRARLTALRRPDAALVLSTAHATKGLEFDDVIVIMDEGRFPSPRAIAGSLEPARALEEERRLAYVAWTRARRSLTLVYDPLSPSSFLAEAFTPGELGIPVDELARGPPDRSRGCPTASRIRHGTDSGASPMSHRPVIRGRHRGAHARPDRRDGAGPARAGLSKEGSR